MAIPHDITREHVLRAIAHLRKHGIPPGAESTRYDLVDDEGDRWPPKAVIELAAAGATGVPLSRSEFSGGDETHSSLLTKNDLRPGITISNDDLVQIFAVGNAGGMRWSNKQQCLVIVVDHTK